MHGRMADIAQKIKVLRRQKGLNQRAFGELLGVDQATISRWENGGNYTHENLVALAQLAGVTVDEFENGAAAEADEPQPEPSLLDDLEIIGEHDPDERANYEAMIRRRAAAVRARRSRASE